MQDTRIQVLADVQSWVDSRSGSTVFWLNGLAGTGKTTISRTVCQRLDDQGLLGASFFISRQTDERRGAINMVHSIAHQLARRNQRFMNALCATLGRFPELATGKNLQKQISELLIEPARALTDEVSLVVVIDALDESFDDDHGQPGGEFLPLLIRGLMELSRRLKLFITSRTEPSIQRMFKNLSASAHQEVMQLHDLDQNIVRADIVIYLRRSFDSLVERRSDLTLGEGWPSAVDIDALADSSGKLFVYASTVVRFLNSKWDPNRLLDHLLRRRDGGFGSPYSSLDRLYTQVLSDSVETTDDDGPVLCQRLRDVMGVIVLVSHPLRAGALANLLDRSYNDVQLAIKDLASLLLSADNEPVRVFHPSFPDFIMDRTRCKDPRFLVSSPEHHRILAYRCLCLLNAHLQYDIAGIGDPNIENDDVPELQNKLDREIRAHHASGAEYDSSSVQALPEALRYASRYCFHHLALTKSLNEQLEMALVFFCQEHLLHWLEFLSLIGSISLVAQGLSSAISWCEVQRPDQCVVLRGTDSRHAEPSDPSGRNGTQTGQSAS
jgi:hypothetical protein